DDTAFIDNEVLIVVKDGVSETQVQQLANKYECEIVGAIEVSGDYQLRMTAVSTKKELESILEQIEKEEIIDSASLNYVMEVSEADTEGHAGFYYGDIWKSDLQNESDIKGTSWGIEAINVMGAWDELKKHQNSVIQVKLGLVDSGFDTNHVDLGFAEVFYDRGRNGVTSGNTGHGTHVAGIMAAKTQTDKGICGVYPYGEGRLYGVACCGGEGAEEINSTMIAEKVAMAELIVRNVKVINSSRGIYWSAMPGFSDWYDKTSTDGHFEGQNELADILGEFLEKLLDKGYDFVIVSAAGNNSSGLPSRFDCRLSSWYNGISRLKYPQVYDRIIVVGAVNYKLNISSYSDGGDRVDIYAPGGDFEPVQEVGSLQEFSPTGFEYYKVKDQRVNLGILSTVPDNIYGVSNGTSMAAPHVSGVAAMVWSANNSLTGAEVKKIITENWSSRCTSCHMVDAQLAVKAAFETKGTGKNTNTENGGVLCYVVEEGNESKKVEKAKVSLVNIETAEIYETSTDAEGHFELMVPEGKYYLFVDAYWYEDYQWPGIDELPNYIEVRKGEINYLDRDVKDWIKMKKVEPTMNHIQVNAVDLETGEPIKNELIKIAVRSPKVLVTDDDSTTDPDDGSSYFTVFIDPRTDDIETMVTFHITGYKDCILDKYLFSPETVKRRVIKAMFEREDTSSDPSIAPTENSEADPFNNPSGQSDATAYENADGYIVFGHYEQDNNTGNGKEPIEWEILDENANGKLLISRYVLDAVPFNNEHAEVTWETSSLREWLNNDFLNEAFSKAEQTLIPKVHLKNSGVEMPGGNDTEDQIFCLSLEEVAKYYEVELDKYAFFGFCKELITLPTEYAKANGLHTFRAKDCIDEPIGDEYWMDGYAPKGYQASITDLAGTYWWLRTMGWDTDVCAVFPNGYAGPHYESGVSSGGYGVRPVLYLKQDSEEVVEKSKLYDAFLRNEATAHFRKDADDTQQFNIKKKLSDGRAYTLDDILKLATKGWGDSISFGEPQYKYIDCGLDGVKELLVSIPVNTYAEDFTIDMIVKDIKGELSICYVCDEWSRSHTMITDSGMIVNGGSGGASSGSVEKSFVDKEGAWKKWYKRFEEGSPSSVVFNGSSVNLTDLDLESLALVKYTVDDETYCCLEQYLGREPVTPRSTVDTVKARLKKVGMKIYSSEEIETILTERKKAIGLEDEIVSYKLPGGEP
ncbi:MAG: S8 family serine peptidase, partial [Lachnospiraceae bacterium]|nr:S8 family serine peptidase [Lachnospiraceae bacterium]